MILIDRLIRARRKTIALIVERDGKLVVRAPLRLSRAAIDRMVARKEGWIRLKQAEMRETFLTRSPTQYVEGEGFWYLGQIYRLRLVDKSQPALVLDGDFCLSRPALPHARGAFERWYRAQAQRVIRQRVDRYAGQCGYFPKAIRIGSARTRWGSCSSRGTLSFPWRLVMAPLEVIDYIVVHELVHLKVHNHSKQFWSLVEEILPDYRARQEWLRRKGHLLSLD